MQWTENYSDGHGNSFSNGPDGSNPVPVRHDEFCPCIYCLQGHR